MQASLSSESSNSSNSSNMTMNQLLRECTKFRLPASFVVLQGSAGDGLCNTIDSLPPLPEDVVNDTTVRSVSPEPQHPATATKAHDSQQYAHAPPRTSGNLDGSYVVVLPEAPSQGSSRPPQQSQQNQNEKAAEELWKAHCRQEERQMRQEWLYTAKDPFPRSRFATTVGTTTDTGSQPQQQQQHNLEWYKDPKTNCLAVLESVPHRELNGTLHIPRSIGCLPPGSTWVASNLLTLRSDTLEPVTIQPIAESHHNETASGTSTTVAWPAGRKGWLQLFEFDYHNGQTAYCVASVDGYSLVSTALTCGRQDAASPEQALDLWRVTCSAGAFVRDGLDLSTRHLDTLPYGSFVQVTQKTINAMGLARLRVAAFCPKSDGAEPERLEGWCSECLNPLSGQRGAVLQRLPWTQPAQVRVVLAAGAVLRRHVELSSPVVGQAPLHTILTVTGRAFTEHPKDACLERLRLAGGGGWISARLNKPPPLNAAVVEWLGVADSTVGDFMERPAQFHWKAMRLVRWQSTPGADAANLLRSTPHDDDDNHKKDEPQCVYSSPMAQTSIESDSSMMTRRNTDTCLICLDQERTATLVHRETGHICCCLQCARILQAKGDPCPVCRLPIDAVIQHFWA